MELQWAGELRRMDEALVSAQRAIRALTEWCWVNAVADDVRPRSLPAELEAALDALRTALAVIAGEQSNAFQRYSAEPAGKFLSGLPLTREEYYLVAAMGASFGTAKEMGLSDVDDYELFCHLCYEDETRYTYINPLEAPRAPREAGVKMKVGARFGAPPEDLFLTALRPEQREFIETHLPTVYARFRRG